MVDQELKKQNVLIIHNYYQFAGGEDMVVENEKKMLKEHGHRVTLYSRHNSEIKAMPLVKKIWLPFSMIFNPRTYREVRKIIIDQHIDVVHVHNTLNLTSPAVYYAALRCNVPVLQTIHNFRFICPGATFYRNGHICEDCIEDGLGCAIKHGCYRKSRLQTLICVMNLKVHRLTGVYRKINLICLTEFTREKLLLLNKNEKRQIVNPKNIFIKPNFTFEEEGETHSGEYYLYMGRIEEIKGIGLLLEAFKQMPDKKLKIAGTGPDIEKYKKYNLENTEFLGFLDRQQLNRCLKSAKAVIVPSQWYETFGMIIAEAYAAHKPVIVGDIGNIASLVEEEQTGLKFQYDSAEALVSAIKKFETLNQTELEEKAYRKYQEELTMQHNYKILKDIYDQITNI